MSFWNKRLSSGSAPRKMKKRKGGEGMGGGATGGRRADEYMTSSPVKPLILQLAAPTMVSMLVIGLYNTADTFFVSQIDTSASAAVGVVFALMALIQAVGFTLGTGAASVISRALGARDDERAHRFASSALAAAVGLGTVMTLGGWAFVQPICRLLGSTETALPYAVSYASVILVGAPVMACAFVLNTGLRAEGKAHFAMMGLASGGLLNMALDPLFIFGFGWGIAGAAVATVVSQVVSLSVMLSWYRRGKSVVHHGLRFVSRSPADYLEILRVGSPAFFRQGLASLSAVLLNLAAAGWGDAALAAMTIVKKITMMLFAVGLGVGQGYQPVAGYSYGAGNWRRVREAYLFTLGAIALSFFVVAALVFWQAPALMKAFIKDSQVVEIGTTALRWQVAALPFLAINLMASMTYQAVGRSLAAALLSVCRNGIFFVPLIFAMPALWGLAGLVAVQAICDLCTALVSVPATAFFLRDIDRRIDRDDTTVSNR